MVTSAFIHSPQGMVLTGDGRALIAADYRHGLIRIPLVGTDTITRITDSAGRGGGSRGADHARAAGDPAVAAQTLASSASHA